MSKCVLCGEKGVHVGTITNHPDYPDGLYCSECFSGIGKINITEKQEIIKDCSGCMLKEKLKQENEELKQDIDELNENWKISHKANMNLTEMVRERNKALTGCVDVLGQITIITEQCRKQEDATYSMYFKQIEEKAEEGIKQAEPFTKEKKDD